ncbi:MAG: hypothetical protein ACTS40_00970 [Candidatus Hodgkinia cicadicola]
MINESWNNVMDYNNFRSIVLSFEWTKVVYFTSIVYLLCTKDLTFHDFWLIVELSLNR